MLLIEKAEYRSAKDSPGIKPYASRVTCIKEIKRTNHDT
jgi:hypothetical protein